MPSYNANWQLLLYLFRLIFLIPLIILWFWGYFRKQHHDVAVSMHFTEIILPSVGDSVLRMGGHWLVFLIPVIWTCINDVYMLTWDTYAYGSILAGVIPQVFTSLSFVVISSILLESLILEIGSRYQFGSIESVALCMTLVLIILWIISAILLAIHITLWIKAPRGALKRGVRDLQHRSDEENSISIFGWKRPPGERDQLRKTFIWGGQVFWLFFKSLPTYLKTIIFRRVGDVESQRFAATRNVTAILLLAMLVAQSVFLFHGVIYKDFSNRENWVDMIGPVQSSNPSVIHSIQENGASQVWSVHFMLGVSETFNASTDDVLTSNTNCSKPQGSPNRLEKCRNHAKLSEPSGSMDVFDVVLTANTNGTSMRPGRIWIGYSDVPPEVLFYPGVQQNILPEVLFDPGIQLIPSWHLFGLIGVTVRKTIRPSLPGMLGFSESYDELSMTSVDFIERTALNNASIARATLQVLYAGNPVGKIKDKRAKFRIIQEYREHTLLGALSSIGGLLAVLQGLHLLCFGRPLFWGLFGSKLLDPFGVFSRFSGGLARRAVAHYGFAPGKGFSTAQGLGLFLSDFVIDIAPLRQDCGNSTESQESREGLRTRRDRSARLYSSSEVSALNANASSGEEV